jgi:hypothetical protein
MTAVHYSAAELAELLKEAAFAYRIRELIEACEQCCFLLALVRHAEGEPTDEQAEVLIDTLQS